MLRLDRLVLTEFRNYAALVWQPRDRCSVLVGPNGSGKTNLLEAVSLLVPGRGLRNARASELPRRGGSGVWAVAGRFLTGDGAMDLGTGSLPDGPGDRRTFRLNGATPRGQAEVAARIAAVWITPRMDRLFHDGPSGRRRFFDRLVWAFDPGHAREIAAYDGAMAQRNRLLAEHRGDPAWLAGLEDAMARHGVAAAAARMSLARGLNAVRGDTGSAFPVPCVGLICAITERLESSRALEVEDWFRANLAANRERDAASGMTLLGVHRADMTLTDVATAIEAPLASTGQQKALLIGLVLGHARLLAEARGFAPLLLLDEPAVHLDEERRALLFRTLRDSPAQIIMTGVDVEPFLPFFDGAEIWRVDGGELHCLKGDSRVSPLSSSRAAC